MALTAGTVFEIRADGVLGQGAAFDSSFGGTDYSQQAAPQLSLTDGVSNTGTSTFTSVTGGFTAAMVGNCIGVTQGGSFRGYWQITAFNTTNSVTVDRNGPVTASNCIFKVGGASILSALGIPGINDAGDAVAGNTWWVRAGTYALTVNAPTFSLGTVTQPCTIEGYNTTRGDCSADPTLTRPTINYGANSISLLAISGDGCQVKSLTFDNTGGTNTALLITGNNNVVENCRITASTSTAAVDFSTNSDRCLLRGCYLIASSTNSDGVVMGGNGGHCVEQTHIRSAATTVNNFAGVVATAANCTVRQCIIEKFTYGILCSSGTASSLIAEQNVIHRNTNGIYINNAAQGVVNLTSVRANIFSRNTTAVRYNPSDISTNAGAIAWMATAFDCNFFYSNTTNFSQIPAGANSTTLTADPFTDEAAYDFSLNTTAGGGAAVSAALCARTFADGINSSTMLAGPTGVIPTPAGSTTLRSLWREYTNEPFTDPIDDNTVDIYIQGGLEELNRRWQYHYTTDSSSVVLVAGTQEYDLPDDCIEVKFVQWNGRELGKTSVEQLRSRDQDWRAATGQPKEWAHYGNKLVIIPIPTAETVAAAASPTIRYISTPPSVTSSGPEQLPSDAYRLAVLYGVWMWSKMFPDSAVAASRGEGALQAFEQGVASGIVAYQARGMMR